MREGGVKEAREREVLPPIFLAPRRWPPGPIGVPRTERRKRELTCMRKRRATEDKGEKEEGGQRRSGVRRRDEGEKQGGVGRGKGE